MVKDRTEELARMAAVLAATTGQSYETVFRTLQSAQRPWEPPTLRRWFSYKILRRRG